MKKPDTILDEIHTIRRNLYEATKDMSTLERAAYFNTTGERLAKEFGFKRISVDEVLKNSNR